jgi:hypothetical protein
VDRPERAVPNQPERGSSWGGYTAVAHYPHGTITGYGECGSVIYSGPAEESAALIVFIVIWVVSLATPGRSASLLM